jgi:hypothetical protein
VNVEIGKLSLHLPSGACSIWGFVRGEEGNAESGTTLFRERPVALGGAIRLFEGLDPMRHSTNPGPIFDLRVEPPGFDRHGFDWAGRSTSDAQAAAQRHGFTAVTREAAAEVLIALGYQVRPRRDPATGRANFHDALWSEQADGLTWHVRESLEGTRFTYERCVFLTRALPEPSI